MKWEVACINDCRVEEPYVVRWRRMGTGGKDYHSSNRYFVHALYKFLLRRHAEQAAELLNANGKKPKDFPCGLLETVHWSKFE